MKTSARIFILSIALLSYKPASAADRMTLDQFLNEARHQNLSWKAETAAAAAAQEASRGLAIPPPMAGVTQMKDQSGSANGFEISQTIPFPTKLTNDHSARKFEAKAQMAMKKSREKEILAEAKLLYFRLWQTQERIKLLQEKKSALEQHIKLATASARSDSFMKIHLIKTESDLDLLENELLQAEQENKEKLAQAAAFLNRDPKDFGLVIDEMPLSSLPKEEALSSPYSLESKKLEVESLRARENAAKSEWLPDFNIRYREMGGTGMTPRFSEVMVGASLPFLFFWEPQAQSGKAAAERMRAEAQLGLEKRKTDSDQKTLFSKAQSLKRQIEQLTDKILPRAEKRVRLVHNLAPRDLETLQEHREAMESLPELRLRTLELRAQYEEAVAELEKYTSAEGQK